MWVSGSGEGGGGVGQTGYEQSSGVFFGKFKIQKKKLRGGGRAGGQIRGWIGGWGSKVWGRWVMWGMGM